MRFVIAVSCLTMTTNYSLAINEQLSSGDSDSQPSCCGSSSVSSVPRYEPDITVQ